MESDHVGVQTALGQRAGLRGLPRRALFVGGADAAVAISRRASTIPTACARTRRSPSASSSTRSPASRSRRSCSRGRRRRGRCRPTWRLAVKPDADYARDGEGRRALDPRRRLARALRRGARRLRQGRHPQGRRTRRPHLRAAVPVLRRQDGEGAFRVVSAASSSSWARAPASSTSRRPSARTTSPSAKAAGLPRGRSRSTSRATSPTLAPPYAGQERLRRQQGHHPRPQGARASSSATRPTTTTIRIAGGPTSR